MFKWTSDEFRRSQSSLDSLDYLVLRLVMICGYRSSLQPRRRRSSCSSRSSGYSGFATCLFTTEDGGLEEEEPDFANFVFSG